MKASLQDKANGMYIHSLLHAFTCTFNPTEKKIIERYDVFATYANKMNGDLIKKYEFVT